MSVQTFEGVVENGRILLREPVRLPERARVYVVVPGDISGATARIVTPHLAHPAQAADFVKEIVEADSDAGV